LKAWALLALLPPALLVSCGEPGRRQKTAQPVARAETSESADVPKDAPQDSDRERLAAEDALSDAREAVRNAEDVEGKEKQRQAYRDIRTLGTAISSSIMDHPSGSSSGLIAQKPTYDPNDCPLISHGNLEGLLSSYLQKGPVTDP